VKKGSEIGSEVGFFESFAKIWIALLSKDPTESVTKRNQKAVKELSKLLLLAQTWMSENSRDENVWLNLTCMRNKYTLICTLLQLKADFKNQQTITW